MRHPVVARVLAGPAAGSHTKFEIRRAGPGERRGPATQGATVHAGAGALVGGEREAVGAAARAGPIGSNAARGSQA
jgi:hypothetical protein